MLFQQMAKQIPICLQVLKLLEMEKKHREAVFAEHYAPSPGGNLCGFETE